MELEKGKLAGVPKSKDVLLLSRQLVGKSIFLKVSNFLTIVQNHMKIIGLSRLNQGVVGLVSAEK